jgi:hypothetical protein
VKKIDAAVLLYIGLKNWGSVRELEQAVELAKVRAINSNASMLELAHIALPQDVEDVEADLKRQAIKSIDILGSPAKTIDIE